MKEGVDAFIHHAKLLRRYGAAVVVMALTNRAGPIPAHGKSRFAVGRTKSSPKVGFPAEDIIFDPNIFAVATGIEEHNNYAQGLYRRV